jgi:hypothetical protein
MGGTNFTILCAGRRGREFKPCAWCDRRSDRLCDAEVAPGKTCDARMCSRCSIRVGRDADYCRRHRAEASALAARLRAESGRAAL